MLMNCKGKLIDFSTPAIMGILNMTPDSFYFGSRISDVDAALRKTEKMLSDGADFIDIGGMSTRPGSEILSEEQELNRVVPVIQAIQERFPESLISIDTYRAKVAEEAVLAGAAIINDISAGNLDDKLFETVAKLQVPYILMHMQGNPQTMQLNPTYENVVEEVNLFLSEKIYVLKKLGVNDIILDPGFGFGKTVRQNYELLRHLDLIGFGEYPILVGVSRKSMITKLLNIKTMEALNGTTALNVLALEKGANILRVHDVKAAWEAVQIWNEFHAAE